MRILAITNLFPNAREPNRGCFNLQQFAVLGRHAEVRVIAPVAWQPWASGWRRALPHHDSWNGIAATYPSYVYTPGVGRAAYALLMACSIRNTVRRTVREYRPDVLLATWAYPDVVAAALLARPLRLPVVAKVHGSDVNLFTVPRLLRAQIRWALRQASSTFAVSTPLRDRLVEIGVPASRIHVQHNGVDVERFRLMERVDARTETGLPTSRPVIVYVGNLKEGKGVLDLVEAASSLKAASGERPLIVLVGEGAARAPLEAQIRRHGLAEDVRLAGAQPHESIPLWLAAADVFCLPSHREGCPNVVLEALACGRPVVATDVGAIPDLIDATSGILVPAGEPERLAAALGAALARDWDATRLRARVLPLSWEANAHALARALSHASHHSKPPATKGVPVFRCSGVQEDPDATGATARAAEHLSTRTPEHLNT